jgi:hypothetical protein
MEDVWDKEAPGEAKEVTMSETAITTATETVNGAETETRALATIDYSDPAQLRKVIRVDHCGAGDRS